MKCSTWALPSQFLHNQRVHDRVMGARPRVAKDIEKKFSSLISGFFPGHLGDPTRGRNFIVHYYAH
ncbi:MAG: hypothetical protein KC592_06600, partial [Nitrospira sp.]|nr:hypothetical protein [Nitrospira sp.]